MDRRLERLGVDLGQGKVLKDEVSAGVVGQQLGDDGLCVLAVGTLKIRELNQLDGFGCAAL